jgi:hypothetical protein
MVGDSKTVCSIVRDSQMINRAGTMDYGTRSF